MNSSSSSYFYEDAILHINKSKGINVMSLEMNFMYSNDVKQNLVLEKNFYTSIKISELML